MWPKFWRGLFPSRRNVRQNCATLLIGRMAQGPGFEPGLADPKSAVLPVRRPLSNHSYNMHHYPGMLKGV